MYELLKKGVRPQRGSLALHDFQRSRDWLARTVEQVRDYRRANPMGLPGEHLLAVMLNSLNVPLSMEPEIYVDRVSDITFNLARSLQLSTPVSVGGFRSPGLFYGKNVSELIWVNIDPFDRRLLRTSWRDLQSIRVLHHPRTDLTLDVPDGRFSTPESGWAVIVINLPMLAGQYRMWRAEREKLDAQYGQRTVMHFLMEVPLPNMLYSHVDLALFNRLMAYSFGHPLPQVKGHHTFAVSDRSSDVDLALKSTLTFIEGERFSFDDIVSAVPTVFANDLHDVLRLPDLHYMSQLQPAVIAARSTLASFLVQLNYLTDNPVNGGYLNYLRQYLRRNHQGKFLSNTLPRAHYQMLQTSLDQGIAQYL